jgi:hypothetical protein
MPELPPAVGHPTLPLMPSQRQPASPRQQPDLSPTADRPALPTRPAETALASPTVAYPTVTPSASPELQVAVGFVTPDGRKIPPAPRPVSPNPSGWGAALAAMPPPPPPPAPEPALQERSEAPIFLQMQASWFKGQDATKSADDWGMPTAGYPPRPLPTEPNGSAGTAAPAASPAPPAAPAARSVESPARVAGADAVAASAGGPGPQRPRPAPTGPDAAASTPAASTPAASTPAASTPASAPPAASPPAGSPSIPRQRTAAEDRWRTTADEGWHRALAAAEPKDAGTTRSGLPKRVPQAQLVPGGVETGLRNNNRRSPDEVRGLLSAYHRGVQRGRTAGSQEADPDAPVPKENNQ